MEINRENTPPHSAYTGHSLYLGVSRLLTDQKTYVFALVFFASLAIFGADFCGLFLAVFAVGYLFHLCDPEKEGEQVSNPYTIYGTRSTSQQQEQSNVDLHSLINGTQNTNILQPSLSRRIRQQ